MKYKFVAVEYIIPELLRDPKLTDLNERLEGILKDGWSIKQFYIIKEAGKNVFVLLLEKA